MELKKREINSQIEHIEEANADIPEDLYTSKEYADCMEQELKDDRSPLLESNITVCLSDSSLDGLEKKCARVKELYDDMNIIIERPLGTSLNCICLHSICTYFNKRFCNCGLRRLH